MNKLRGCPMINPFPYSDTNKRYHTYDYYLRHRYSTKCARIPIDAGFSCPNRSPGGEGGCTYCSARGSGDFCADTLLPPQVQFAHEYERLCEKWGRRLPAIPYFQAFSGTFSPIERLREIYGAVSDYRLADGSRAEIPALIIATRPDCLCEEVVAYLSTLASQYDLTVELGLQSAHDATLRRIRRGHDFDTFCRGYHALTDAGIDVCVHVINGLPTEGKHIEDRTQMIETASRLAALRPAFVKIHMLHILRGTQMEQEYLRGEIHLLSMEEYVSIVCEQLTLLPPTTVVCRLTGDGAQKALIAPQWTKNKRAVLASIDRTLAQGKQYQGIAFSDTSPTNSTP